MVKSFFLGFCLLSPEFTPSEIASANIGICRACKFPQFDLSFEKHSIPVRPLTRTALSRSECFTEICVPVQKPYGDKIMKLQLALLSILVPTCFAVLATAFGTDRLFANTLAADSAAVDYSYHRITYSDACEVITDETNLNVRKAPLTGAIIGRLPKGGKVNVNDRWTRISASVNRRSVTGWVADRFLDAEGYVATEEDNLNVRTAPLNGSVIGKLPNGTKVKVLDKWANVSGKDASGGRVSGWVSADFLGNCN